MTLRKLLALCLTVLTVLGLFAACAPAEPDPTTEPAETTAPPTEPSAPVSNQTPEEVRKLRILTLGHSLAVDSCHMLNLVCATEGIGEYEEIQIATLYYSGCPLIKHLTFAMEDKPEYNLYLSSTATPDQPPVIEKAVTMKYALEKESWDIIVMQGGVFEIAVDTTYTDVTLKGLINYVNKYKKDPAAIFAWHMPWATPTDNELRDKYPYDPNSYYSNYAKYDDDRSKFYQGITGCVERHIMTNDTFQFLIPSGTSIENALSSYLEEKDLHRDYAHATDYGRVIAAYTWYCKLMGIEKLDAIKLDAIPVAFFKSTKGETDRVLTDAEKAIALEAINNALKEPLKMTQSQYTTAPAQ